MYRDVDMTQAERSSKKGRKPDNSAAPVRAQVQALKVKRAHKSTSERAQEYPVRAQVKAPKVKRAHKSTSVRAQEPAPEHDLRLAEEFLRTLTAPHNRQDDLQGQVQRKKVLSPPLTGQRHGRGILMGGIPVPKQSAQVGFSPLDGRPLASHGNKQYKPPTLCPEDQAKARPTSFWGS